MKSWSCIENCGACCRFDLHERGDLSNKLSSKDIDLINTMTSNDGWCKYLYRSNKKCSIYENRPDFCRVNKFSVKFKGYLRKGDEFLIDCCKEHIKSIYGKKSNQMNKFKMTVLK